MPRVRIKLGMHHSAWDPGTDPDDVIRQHAPRCYGGSVLDISDEELEAFQDKFESVTNATRVKLIRDPAKVERPAARK